jgi:hypothetical protein
VTPGTITPDPQFPDAIITMKAPPGMENCVDLTYRVVQHPSIPGKLAIVAEFIPTETDLTLLTAGQPLRFMMTLLQAADTGAPIVPPIALWARGYGEV